MMQNVHNLVEILPDDSQQLADAFYRRFKPQRVGTLMSDILATGAGDHSHEQYSPRDIDRDTRDLLEEWKGRRSNYSKLDTPYQAHYLRRCEYRGGELKPRTAAFGDSLVIVGNETNWRAAEIEALLDIRLYPSGMETHHTVAKVSYFSELSATDELHDPYRRFQNTGRIFYTQDGMLSRGVVSIEEVLCHFAMTPNVCSDTIPRGHIHALPLIRVRWSSLFALCTLAPKLTIFYEGLMVIYAKWML